MKGWRGVSFEPLDRVYGFSDRTSTGEVSGSEEQRWTSSSLAWTGQARQVAPACSSAIAGLESGVRSGNGHNTLLTVSVGLSLSSITFPRQ